MSFWHNSKRLRDLIFSLACIVPVWIIFTYGLEETIALKGFSAITWLNKLKPNSFANDFPSGVELYSKALFMYIYIPLGKLLSGLNSIKLIIFIELFFTVIAMKTLAKMFHAKSEKSDRILTLLLFLVYAFSFSRNMNWGRWGHPFYVGQFYVFSDLSRIMGFFFLVKKRLVPSVLFLFLATCIHPTIGLYGIVFSSFYLIFSKINLRQKFYYLLFCLMGLLLNFFLVTVLFKDKNLIGIATQDWMFFGKFFSAHLFPVQFGFFSKYFFLNFFPSLVFLYLMIYCFVKFKNKDEIISYDFLAATGGIGLLVLLGVLVSSNEMSIFLVKLALPRASEIVISLGVIILIKYLYDFYQKSQSKVQQGVMLSFFLSLFLKEYAWNFLLVALVLYVLSYGFQPNKISKATLAFLLGAISIIGFYKLNGTKIPYTQFILSVSVVKNVFLFLIFLLPFFKIKKDHSLLATLLVGFLFFGFDRIPPEKILSRAEAYKEAQIWAKNNTQDTALFLVDPSIFYGWREYSERSSFGNVREWLHNAWLYNNDGEAFAKGLQRAQGFIDPYEFTKNSKTVNVDTSKIYIEAIKKKFYRNENNFLKGLIEKYHIGFIVSENVYKGNFPGSVVYSNSQFSIYEVTNSEYQNKSQ